MEYCNAGHLPVLLKGGLSSGTIELSARGAALGMFENDPERYEIKRFSLLQNQSLFAYTDGCVEQFNEKGDEFGHDNFKKILTGSESNEEIHVNLFKALDSHRGSTPIGDDISFISIQKI